jgi:hypothetical protein
MDERCRGFARLQQRLSECQAIGGVSAPHINGALQMGSGDVYFAVSQRGNTQKESGIGLPGMILDNGFAGLFDLSIPTAPHGFTCLRE